MTSTPPDPPADRLACAGGQPLLEEALRLADGIAAGQVPAQDLAPLLESLRGMVSHG